MRMSFGRPTDDELEDMVNTFSDMLFKLCFTLLCDKYDAEDAVSDTFLRYMTYAPKFNGEEHKKAWLLRTASNICNDRHRYNKKHSFVNLDDITEYAKTEEDTGVIEALLKLPEKYKSVIHLHYIEGYKSGEIAKIIGISSSAVRKRLQTGRVLLRKEYEKEEY